MFHHLSTAWHPTILSLHWHLPQAEIEQDEMTCLSRLIPVASMLANQKK
jgi:hypothetical protein